MIINYYWVFVLLIVTFNNSIMYLTIRDILWSIVRLNTGGKLKKLNDLKKTVRKDESIFQIISMNCLNKYVTKNLKEFQFWKKVKTAFCGFEGLLEIGYIICGLILKTNDSIKIISIIILAQELIILFVLQIQYGFGKNTKYDKKRINK